MNLNSGKELDWLQLSRFTGGSSESILALDGLLYGRALSREMFQRLPKGYIARLLKVVRNELLNCEQNEQLIEQVLAMRHTERNQLLHKQQQLQIKLAQSKSKLSIQHDEIKVKMQVLKKIASKIERKRKAVKRKPQQEKEQEPQYYCPFCRMDKFSDRNDFEKHMLQLHNPSTQESSVQNFILELKDKEIALMELVMKKNEDMNEAARTILDRQLHSRTEHFRKTLGTTGENTVKCAQLDDELLCQSEYVAFQNQNKSEENLPKYYDTSAQKERIHENIMQRHMHMKSTRHAPVLMQSLPAADGFFRTKTATANNTRQQWTVKEPNAVPQQQTQPLRLEQPTPLSLRAYETPNPSYRVLTYETVESKKQPSQNPNGSIYQHHSSLSAEGYVYCSGPLQDDDSDSQVGDYFFRRASQKLIVDQDIVLDDKLLSKWGSSIMQHQDQAAISPSKARLNSELLSAQDSIEDKDFSLSKDSNDINLSDLRYSKILRAKQAKENELKSEAGKPTDHQELFAIAEKEEPNTARQSACLGQLGQLSQYIQNAPPALQGTACFNPASFRKKSPSKRSSLLQDFFGSGEQEQPRKRSSSKVQKSLPSSANEVEAIKKKPSCRRTENPIVAQPKHRSKIEPQSKTASESHTGDCNPEHPDPATDPTERYILKQLDDLTLIKQDEAEQTINVEVHPE